MSSIPQLVFFSLTPEEDEDVYPQSPQDYEDQPCTWIDDSECQENLFHIVSLTPEETIIDKDNHIHTSFKLFFEELGYLTEEPEPIDPSRDYDQEARDLLSQRDKKVRQKHVNLSHTPSLDYTRSGISSSSSSIHHEHHLDIRSPHYMGNMLHHYSPAEHTSYHYGANLDPKHHPYHHHRPSRLH
jgi:hypothetical protein